MNQQIPCDRGLIVGLSVDFEGWSRTERIRKVFCWEWLGRRVQASRGAQTRHVHANEATKQGGWTRSCAQGSHLDESQCWEPMQVSFWGWDRWNDPSTHGMQSLERGIKHKPTSSREKGCQFPLRQICRLIKNGFQVECSKTMKLQSDPLAILHQCAKILESRRDI